MRTDSVLVYIFGRTIIHQDRNSQKARKSSFDLMVKSRLNNNGDIYNEANDRLLHPYTAMQPEEKLNVENNRLEN